MEMLIKVGPHGGGRGDQWDDRGQSTLTHIFVSYGSEWINSIQTGYILGQKLQLSNKHGGNGDMFAMVEIDYPSEFLTGINGYYGDETENDDEENDYAVKALTFETNIRKFGPFGKRKAHTSAFRWELRDALEDFMEVRTQIIFSPLEFM